MSAEWYYLIEGIEIGPISGDEIKCLADTCKILPSTSTRRVFRGESTPWTRAGAIKVLYSDNVIDKLGPPICDDCGSTLTGDVCCNCQPSEAALAEGIALTCTETSFMQRYSGMSAHDIESALKNREYREKEITKPRKKVNPVRKRRSKPQRKVSQTSQESESNNGFLVVLAFCALLALFTTSDSSDTSSMTSSSRHSSTRPRDMPQNQWDYLNRKLQRELPGESRADIESASRAIWEFEKAKRTRGEY
ncbi:DUF4339 domain-containing protein [Adhaeretor mobilis]|uniref:Uncharacterized protein n=1 Tax=Adhaeretor mobilis TaxID=1930276 RepID=A0A517MS38_9BACT|nr:DUF4339 domain-containing protein [Adhaeretor mobilis]QDS97691.1 hypothetical protein HG15A2_09550 [Adhaeretor mobilis]